MNFTDNEIEDLFKGIFEGNITKEDLPVNLYTAIAEFLQDGVYKGYGGTVGDFSGTDLEFLQELRTNIYMFSAAKTYQEVRDMTDLMYEGERVKPFSEFFEDAKALYDNYNVNYAQTEYNTAVASASMGAKWNEIEKDKELFPLLKMTVVEDAQTTEICEPLDGIILPVNDPFWDEFYPPNHWNCRSTVLQLDEGEASSKADVDKAREHADEDMQDVFKMNVGKDEYIFSPEHPYFKSVPREDRELAKENFRLPLPQDLIERFIPAKNIKEAQQRIEDLGVKYVNFRGYGLEHANASLEALENIPNKAVPDALGNGSAFVNFTKRKFERSANSWYGVSIKFPDLYIEGRSVLSPLEFKDFEIVGINTKEYPTLSLMTERKIKYQEFYRERFNKDYFFNTDAKLTHYHEFGHIYSNRMGLNKPFLDKWEKVADKWFGEAKCDLLKSKNEAFSEAFADYFGNSGKKIPDYVYDFFKENVK